MDDSAATVTIDAQFHGPPGSGNGGYTCGLAATQLTEGPATVRLHRPPPLGVPLEVRRSEHRVELVESGQVVAAAQPWAGPDERAQAPTADQVDAAIATFDLADYDAHHPFPTCFTCGTRRDEGDGLRLFPAAIASTSAVVWRWRADADLGDEAGLVRPEVMWAALDCPGGMAWMHGGDRSEPGPLVLGQLAVAIFRRPSVGEELIVSGWQDGAVDRRRRAGTAAWTADGELIAQGEATWIWLDPEQAAAFAVSQPAPG